MFYSTKYKSRFEEFNNFQEKLYALNSSGKISTKTMQTLTILNASIWVENTLAKYLYHFIKESDRS